MTYAKEYKKGLPGFSNITAHMSLTIEVGPGEVPNHEAIWDEINRELETQAGEFEPSWITGEKKPKGYTKKASET